MKSYRWLWTGLWLLAAVCLGADSELGLDEPSEPQPMLLENVLTLVFAAMAIVVVAWGVIVIGRRVRERRDKEEQAVRMLEAEVVSLLAARRPSPSAGTTPSREAAPPPQTAVGTTGDLPSPSVAASATVGARPDAASAVEAILAKLKAGSLLEGIEGMVYLSDGRTEGKIVRLRGGKTAVILPCLEPAEFLARQIKRFDLCIVALGGDQAAVISPLGSYIADQFSLPR